jgi:hypothetical protein
MSASSSSDRPNARAAPPIPSGGMASPPSDPPAASPTRLRGQVETNCEPESRQSSPQSSAGERKGDEMYSAAYEFGWQSHLQYGRAAATQDVTFENVEPELEKLWSLRQATKGSRMPWQAARETARDAWNQVYDAISADSSAKTKTNG